MTRYYYLKIGNKPFCAYQARPIQIFKFYKKKKFKLTYNKSMKRY